MAVLNAAESSPIIILIVVLLLVYLLVEPWVLSPLRNVPGPWKAIYTKWWLVRVTVRGKRAETIHEVHQKYGSWVRISPNEVSTCDPSAISPIYGVSSAYVKTEFYTYQLRGEPELFTMSDRSQHARRRRELAHLFSMSTITEYAPVINKQVKLCMDYIAEEGRSGRTSNLYDWWHFLSMDITCDLSFGSTFNMLQEGVNNAYIKDLYGSLQIEPIRWHFGWLNRYASWAPLRFVRDAEACSVRAMNRGARIVQEYIENPEKKRRKDLLQKMLDARDESGGALSVEALNTEAAGIILAGSHTTSSSLTWIVWRIIRDPSVLHKMLAELDSSLSDVPRSDVPPHSKLEHLQYFNCVIKEGLRIDTAVPGSTPRYVPPGGAVINGVNLPGGAIVSAQAYSCHRDPKVFPEPERFKPERWLDETPEMRRLYIPFGADGPRKCIGIYLAYMELRVILANLFHRFDLIFSSTFEDKNMEMDEFWLANPIGQDLSIIATERRR